MAVRVFTFDSLSPALQELFPRIDAAVDVVFDQYEAIAESYMRSNASWTDRTGNARNGLFAQHDGEPMVEHTLTLYHTMHYGFWLEVRWSGKYAIIGPTMFDISPRLSGDLAAAINRAVASI